MRDHDERAGPGVEEVLEDVEGVDVEVVGRLVEEQHVGLDQQQLEQLEAPPLAAGQVAEPRGEPVAGEAEALQQRGGGDLLAVEGLADPPDRLDRRQHPRLGVDLVERLREVLHLDRPALLHPADVGRERPGDQRQQRRLAGAVDADDPDPVARPDAPGGVVEQHALAALEVDVLDVDDVLAEPLAGEPLELQPVTRVGHVVDQGVGRVDAELRLRRTRRGAAPQPGELLAGEVLPPRLGGGRLPLTLGLGEDVRRVAALVGVDRAVVHLPRRLADRVEEPPVVGHHDERARQADEVSGQPGHGLDVEVVGRLVEHDQVVPREQQGGERAAAPLATGQADDRAVEGHPGEQLLDDLPRGGVGGPLVVLPPAEHRLADACGCRRARRPGGGSRSRRRGCGRRGRCRAARCPSSPRAGSSCRRRCGPRRRRARPPRCRARRCRAGAVRRRTSRRARG